MQGQNFIPGDLAIRRMLRHHPPYFLYIKIFSGKPRIPSFFLQKDAFRQAVRLKFIINPKKQGESDEKMGEKNISENKGLCYLLDKDVYE